MRVLLILLASLLFGTFLQAQEAWTDKSRVMPDKLRKVPVEIGIQHSPNPNYPQATTKADSTTSKYVWKHKTSVIAFEKELTVVEAGSFIWYSEAGWQANVSLSKKEFAERFACPKGKLMPGIKYTFEKNYRFGDQTYGGDALWYVLAKDDNGILYKGFAILETESEVIEP